MIILFSIVIIFLLVLLVVYVQIFEGEYLVSVSEELDVPVDKVFNTVVDFKSWEKWSPWIMHDPHELVYSETPATNEVGGNYTWNSDKLGEGKVTHKEIIKDSRISQEIVFLKPFKSFSQITWNFESNGDKTKVTWSMGAKLPFVFRWMSFMMKKTLTNDFRSGLLMLHKLLNDQAPTWKMTFNEVLEMPKYDCIGCMYDGKLDDNMKKEIEKNYPEIEKHKLPDNQSTYITMSTKFSQRKNTITLYYGLSPAPKGETIDNLLRFEVAAGKYMKATYTGSFDYLELAWHHAASHTRINKLKFGYPRKPYEITKVGPDETKNPNEYVTELYFPVK